MTTCALAVYHSSCSFPLLSLSISRSTSDEPWAATAAICCRYGRLLAVLRHAHAAATVASPPPPSPPLPTTTSSISTPAATIRGASLSHTLRLSVIVCGAPINPFLLFCRHAATNASATSARPHAGAWPAAPRPLRSPATTACVPRPRAANATPAAPWRHAAASAVVSAANPKADADAAWWYDRWAAAPELAVAVELWPARRR